MAADTSPPLRIDDLIGAHRIIWPGEQLTVGRAGEFTVGTDDPYLHRLFFQLWHTGQHWMIKNRGSAVALTVEVRGASSLSKTELGPGGTMPMPAGASVITFSTKTRYYELNVDIPLTGSVGPRPVRPEAPSDPTATRYTPTLEQEQLLHALSEKLLALPGANDADIPTVNQAAERLQWTVKKTQRKIETLYDRLELDGERVYKPKHIFLAHYAVRQPRK